MIWKYWHYWSSWLAMALAVAPAQAELVEPGNYRFELSGGGNAEQHRQSSEMDTAADRDGYIAVYPNGTGQLRDKLLTWNAGNCCGHTQTQGIDDVWFISAVIDDSKVATRLDTPVCTDLNRPGN